MRAREPERIRTGSLPYTERALTGTHALEGGRVGRHRRDQCLARLALMPLRQGVPDVIPSGAYFKRQCDRLSSRRFQSLRYRANPYCYRRLSGSQRTAANPSYRRTSDLPIRQATRHHHAVITPYAGAQSRMVAADFPAVTAVCRDGLLRSGGRCGSANGLLHSVVGPAQVPGTTGSSGPKSENADRRPPRNGPTG